MHKVILMGAALDTGNRGVSALASSVINLVLNVRPDADISFFIGNKSSVPQLLNAPGGQIKINIINHRLSPRAGFKKHLFGILFIACLQKMIPLKTVKKILIESIPSLKALSEADFIGDIHGGDSFSDIYGVKRFILGVLPNVVILMLGKKLVFLPQTYGPFKSLLSQKIAKHILKRAACVISRDKEGIEVVKEILGKEHESVQVKFCPDVAFVLDSAVSAEVKIEPPLVNDAFSSLVGVNVNGLLYHGGYTRDNMFGLNYDYKEFVRNLVLRLAQDTTGHILLIPHTFGPPGNVNNDAEASRDIIMHLESPYRNRIHIVNGEYDQFTIKGIIGFCDFFIGSRMHACIAALSQGIPTVSVAYSRKFMGVFESIGAGNMVADARKLTGDEIISKIMSDYGQRTDLKVKLHHIDNAKNQIQDTFQSLLRA